MGDGGLKSMWEGVGKGANYGREKSHGMHGTEAIRVGLKQGAGTGKLKGSGVDVRSWLRCMSEG